ncbi:unnamed protein product, partial [marine sediment metagenome]
ADFEADKKQLETLKKERGDLVANELIESQPKRAEKIKKLEKAMADLRKVIEDTPAVIEGLKRTQLSLKSKVEEEATEKTRKEQNELEGRMNALSQKMVSELKKIQEKNSQLKTLWVEWNKLNKVSGKGLEKRCLKPSYGMLPLVVKTLTDEWNGKSSIEIRKYFGVQHFKNNGVVF